jgi:phasin family protein
MRAMTDFADFNASFERLMALFRYRGLDSGSLIPGQGQTVQALIAAGQRVAQDLEDLVRRQAELIESSTRQLMGSTQALARPEQFKEASEANLKTLASAAETTMTHIGELAELLMKYNAEVMQVMNRSVLDTMAGKSEAPVAAAGGETKPASAPGKAGTPRRRARSKARKPRPK